MSRSAPVYGYKSHVSIDRMHGLIRRQTVTDAARHDGGQLREVRSKVEHVFAHQKARMGMTIRTIGLARARAAITLANMAYNMTRWTWLDSRTAFA